MLNKIIDIPSRLCRYCARLWSRKKKVKRQLWRYRAYQCMVHNTNGSRLTLKHWFTCASWCDDREFYTEPFPRRICKTEVVGGTDGTTSPVVRTPAVHSIFSSETSAGLPTSVGLPEAQVVDWNFIADSGGWICKQTCVNWVELLYNRWYWK